MRVARLPPFRIARVVCRVSGALLLASGLASAAHAQTQAARPSLYAVNSAGLAAAMTYCSTRHEGIRQGSPGEACYRKARELLGTMELRTWADEIDRKCADPATYNRCMTPEIGRLVYALNDAFVENGL